MKDCIEWNYYIPTTLKVMSYVIKSYLQVIANLCSFNIKTIFLVMEILIFR